MCPPSPPSASPRGDPRAILSASYVNLYSSRHWPRINRLCETLVFVFTKRKVLIWIFFFPKKKKKKKGRRCKRTEEQKILSLHHQGGGVWILHFQVLIYWILEVGGSPTMKYHIYDLHGRKHETFQCAHACWFLHNVPTESDDVRIISCSLCRATSQPLCQKRFRRHRGLKRLGLVSWA